MQQNGVCKPVDECYRYTADHPWIPHPNMLSILQQALQVMCLKPWRVLLVQGSLLHKWPRRLHPSSLAKDCGNFCGTLFHRAFHEIPFSPDIFEQPVALRVSLDGVHWNTWKNLRDSSHCQADPLGFSAGPSAQELAQQPSPSYSELQCFY